jgi:hypothetical protein
MPDIIAVAALRAAARALGPTVRFAVEKALAELAAQETRAGR